MTALPSIAFGEFSGSAKGVTAHQVGGRSILSVKCWPTGAATGAQLVRRASLKKISKSWKELTSDQMRDWDWLAETATGQSVFGQAEQLSGMNLYVRLNANRAMAGEPLMANAPLHTIAVPTSRPHRSRWSKSLPPPQLTSVPTTWPRTALPALRLRRFYSATTTSTPPPERSRA